jgi:hypothetical protein
LSQKNKFFMKSLLILCSLATTAFADVAVQARITPEALLKLQQGNPVTKATKAVTAKDTAEPRSLIKESTILNDGTHWTLVPKGAVIFTPAAQAARVNAKPTGELLTFLEFSAKNPGWLTTTEISFQQAAGQIPLPPERLAFWSKQDKVVVAVHEKGAISFRQTPTASTTATR